MPARKDRIGFGSAVTVASFFGLSERTVREKAATGEWPSYHVGGRRLFDVDELITLVKSRKTIRSENDPVNGATP